MKKYVPNSYSFSGYGDMKKVPDDVGDVLKRALDDKTEYGDLTLQAAEYKARYNNIESKAIKHYI